MDGLSQGSWSHGRTKLKVLEMIKGKGRAVTKRLLKD